MIPDKPILLRLAAIFSLMLFFLTVSAEDTLRLHRQIKWSGINEFYADGGGHLRQLSFRGAQYTIENPHIPAYYESIRLPYQTSSVRAVIENAVFGIPGDDLFSLEGIDQIGKSIDIQSGISFDRNIPFAVISFYPLRLNPYNGQYEWLLSFDLVIIPWETAPRHSEQEVSYVDHSVLSSGRWFRIALMHDGIYRMTYNDLQAAGINPETVDPRNIRIYGNGGGMLPESLAAFRLDDLTENAIYVSGEEDGSFDEGDYLLFYGQSPHRWKYDPLAGHFNHFQNIYSDRTYYFITEDLGPGKRISEEPSVPLPVTVQVNKFMDYACHERDLQNLINAGRVWYGEVFDISTSYDTTFVFPDIDPAEMAYLKAYVAAKSTSASTFKFYDGNEQILSGAINGIPATSDIYARTFVGSAEFLPSSESLNIKVSYQKPSEPATGWLNYFEVNVVRNLTFTGPQMPFRSPMALAESSVAEFTLSNAPQNVQVWDVTDPVNAAVVEVSLNGSNQVFRLAHDTLREFIAFDGSSFGQVEFAGSIENQDLHGMEVPDMVIVSNDLFLIESQRLAAFHRDMDAMSVEVVRLNQIYNEFSSGAQDITAIRNFMKMLADRGTEDNNLKYLLLFGDASFDYKDRIKDNTNLVPTWEADESLTIVNSIASDDYYGFLDGPGDNLLDIGIGRLPVVTNQQATEAVDKIIHYSTNTNEVMHDWRNVVTFVADDEDANMHFDQAEEMAVFLDTNYGAYNVDKIYVDAFPQYATAGGQRTPDVNKAINNRISKGTLIMNYTGHGGEVGWGHERFLEISDIDSWRNFDVLPVFITATCEFSRYDDPERVSAGELVFLNPIGGAIAMFTTARATYGGSNFNLNQALFEIMFEKNGSVPYRFGDLIRLSKNKNGVGDNDKKFILLGDPALKLASPEYYVKVDSVNGYGITSEPDTLRALSTVEITGEITTEGGLGINDYNGTIYSIVYDKPSSITTLSTDQNSRPAVFELQNNILYKGKSQVENGKFRFSFIVPKDIAYNYGFGKISFYAATDQTDANGYYRNLVIGGFDTGANPDEQGPEISLYMNNEWFIFGGMTDENPDMLAFVSDESGINTVGSGIGHDIVAILDGNTDKPIILNEYYEAELNSYSSGTIRYPFLNLSPGLHTLNLKVWDVFNNSGEAYLEFAVSPSGDFRIENLYNYPNPFPLGTNFIFEHNQPEAELDINLLIYNLSGQIVKTIIESMTPSGYRSEPIYWNGCDEGGYRVAKGMYLYHLKVRRSDGLIREDSGKLIKTD